MTHWRKLTAGVAIALACLLGVAAPVAAKPGDHRKLDRKLNDRANRGGSGTSRVIVTLKPGWDASGDFKSIGGKLGRRLDLINGQVVELPNWLLEAAGRLAGR